MTTTNQSFNQNAAGVDRIAGNRVGLPHGMTPTVGREYLARYQDEQEKVVKHRREYRDWAWQDVAVQLTRALRETFGWASGRPVTGFFGDTHPPTTMRVATGPRGQAAEVLWQTTFYLQSWGEAEGMIMDASGMDEAAFAGIEFEAAQKHANDVTELFDLIDTLLLTESIYQGKAVTTDLAFIDPGTFIDPAQLVFR